MLHSCDSGSHPTPGPPVPLPGLHSGTVLDRTLPSVGPNSFGWGPGTVPVAVNPVMVVPMFPQHWTSLQMNASKHCPDWVGGGLLCPSAGCAISSSSSSRRSDQQSLQAHRPEHNGCTLHCFCSCDLGSHPTQVNRQSAKKKLLRKS